jgi:quinone-modifying oxidoreductase subunit QmoB
MEKIGVFLCTGCEIGDALDVEAIEGVGKECGACHVATHAAYCSPEGVAEIRQAVDDGTVDGVVIAACSHRAKQDEFRLDGSKCLTERVSLREQVAWSHPHGDEDTQMLAEDLLRMGIAKLKELGLPGLLEEPIDRTVLVVGGGLAGMNAALGASGLGHPVTLVEACGRLGGRLLRAKDLVPEEPPYDRPQPNDIADLVARVEADSNIKVLLKSKTKKITGQPGQFEVTVESTDGATETFKVGAIVQATGARPYDASKLGHLGYGGSPNVVTSHELEAMLADGRLECPGRDGKRPERVAFIQCAGSRDPEHLPYCSTDCCATTLKQAAVIHRDFPGVETAVIYKDMRCPAQLEHFYLAVQEQDGSLFTRGEVEKVEGNGSGPLQVQLSKSLLGDGVTLDADLVVLATGMVPNAADGEAIRELRDAYGRIEKNESESQVKAAQEVVDRLKDTHEGTEILNLGYRQGPDLPALRYRYADSHYICFPYETRRTGIYAAGTMRAPMEAAQAREDGWGAAMKAVQAIRANERGEAVHPRAGDIAIADFALQRCTQCKRCTEECPFGTLNEDAKGTPEYNPLRCRRCGICLGSCPERIINFPDYSVGAIAKAIKAMEVPDEDEEKPRMVALLCENDALPALDEAARRKLTWNPWIRVIPVRCLGAVNVVWIADSLSSGIDGFLLIGCKSGDDYQCHYIRGSELAQKRMSNVQETLDRLTLEKERVKIVELARNEFDRIPQIFDEFAEKIEEVGPNPYKGF